MVVTFATVEEIAQELAIEAQAERVFEDTVRIRADETPRDNEGAIFSVTLWVTALIQDKDGDQWILEFGGVAGDDDRTEAQDLEGSEKAAEWKGVIERVAAEHGLLIRGGKIEVI
jgi:hypothetical protein